MLSPALLALAAGLATLASLCCEYDWYGDHAGCVRSPPGTGQTPTYRFALASGCARPLAIIQRDGDEALTSRRLDAAEPAQVYLAPGTSRPWLSVRRVVSIWARDADAAVDYVGFVVKVPDGSSPVVEVACDDGNVAVRGR
jgi:hypothetical protein